MSCRGVVGDDEVRVQGSVPARPARDEVRDRRSQDERLAQRTVVGLVDGACAIVVEESIVGLLVRVRRIRGRLDRERGRSPLNGCAIDPFLPVEERNANASEREALTQDACVRNLVAVLRLEDGESCETGAPQRLVEFHAEMLDRARGRVK